METSPSGKSCIDVKKRIGWIRQANSQLHQMDPFLDLRKLLRKHFGLEIHISHPRDERSASTIGRWVDEEGDALRTTIAHITLANSTKLVKSSLPRYEGDGAGHAYSDDPDYLPSETTITSPVAIPKPLSAEAIARFRRALRVLAIKPLNDGTVDDETIFANDSDKEQQLNDSEEMKLLQGINESINKDPGSSVDNKKSLKAVIPKLMLLMKAEDDGSMR